MSIIPQLIVNSLISGSVFSLIGVSFWLVYSTTKFFNLAHGTVAAVGGYAVFFLTQRFGINIYLAILIGMVFSGLVGFGLDKLIYAPLRKRKASNMVSLVASLGAFIVIQALIAIIFSSQFQTLSTLIPDQKIFQVAGGIFTQIHIVMFCSAIGAFLLLLLLLKKTKFGHAILAVSDDEEVAKIVGINTNQIIGWVFFIGSALAGLTGILVGFDTGIEPLMGLPLLLDGVVGIIMGGMSNIYGAVLGCFILGFVENFGIWKISGEWKSSIAFGVLILFLLFRPQGIIKK